MTLHKHGTDISKPECSTYPSVLPKLISHATSMALRGLATMLIAQAFVLRRPSCQSKAGLCGRLVRHRQFCALPLKPSVELRWGRRACMPLYRNPATMYPNVIHSQHLMYDATSGEWLISNALCSQGAMQHNMRLRRTTKAPAKCWQGTAESHVCHPLIYAAGGPRVMPDPQECRQQDTSAQVCHKILSPCICCRLQSCSEPV